MIVVVGGLKGGSGKSTVATNLCVICANLGRDVLLVDADDQETSTDFTLKRNERTEGLAGYTSIQLAGPAVRTELLRLSPKYQDVIIDAGGRDTSSQRAGIVVADVMVVPFVPRSFDIWTLEKVSSIVEEIRVVNPNLKAYAFINRADPQGHDNDDTADILKDSTTFEFLDTPLGTRKVFGNSGGMGMAVTEMDPGDPKATREMVTLFKRVFDVDVTLNATPITSQKKEVAYDC